jgi:HK97 gp10 family phage protein
MLSRTQRSKMKFRLSKLSHLQRGRVKTAIMFGAQMIVNVQKSLCPTQQELGPGDIAGELRDSIKATTAAESPVKRRVADSELAAIITAGGPEAPHVLHVEYGTQNMSAIPFFGPGFRAMKKPVQRNINKATRDAIREAATT